jgi:hypothetical protein
VFEPSVDYQFGENNHVFINYRNNVFQSENPFVEDSQENYINPGLSYWFNIRNGISLEYGLTLGDFERSSNLVGHIAKGRYTYRFNPRTSTFVEYTFQRFDFEPPSIDFEVNNTSIGIDHAFSPTLTGTMQVGYFWQNTQGGPSTDGFSFNFDVRLAEQPGARTTFTLSFQGGYVMDYFTFGNFGFTKYHRAIASITHRLQPRMTVGISGILERAEYASDRKDWIYIAQGTASFVLFRWLSLSLNASHRGNDSTVDNAEYIENRVLLSLRATL